MFSGNSGDNGPATSAKFSLPSSVAVDRAGNLFISDNNLVRLVKLQLETPTVPLQDIDGNGIADLADLDAVAYRYGTRSGTEQWEGASTWYLTVLLIYMTW